MMDQVAAIEWIRIPISPVDADASSSASPAYSMTVEEDFSIIGVKAEAFDAPTGANAEIDVELDTGGGFASILTTVITIEAGETHSDDATTPPALTTNPQSVSAGDRLGFVIDQVGSTNAGKGFAVLLQIVRPI